MPGEETREVELNLIVTVMTKHGETNDEVRRWLVDQVYQIGDVENVEVGED